MKNFNIEPRKKLALFYSIFVLLVLLSTFLCFAFTFALKSVEKNDFLYIILFSFGFILLAAASFFCLRAILKTRAILEAKNNFIYIFIAIIFGAAMFLTILLKVLSIFVKSDFLSYSGLYSVIFCLIYYSILFIDLKIYKVNIF